MKKPDPASRFRRPEREAQPEASAASIPRGVRLVAAALGGLVLVWLVIRVSLGSALLEAGSAAAAWLAPANPEVAFAMPAGGLQADFSDSEDAVMRMLDAAPLADEPLLFAARRAIRDGETDRGDRLLAEVIRRNPRSRYGLLLQLDRQLRRDQPEEAAATVAVLIRLLPESGSLLVEELARMARDPEVRGAVARIVEQDAGIGRLVLAALARQGTDPDTIFSLAGPLQPAAEDQAPDWQPTLLNALIARGQVSEARQAWNRMAGTASPAGIYDPEFTGKPGPRPFNWHFDSSRDGFAEFAGSSPGLYVEYYGRRDTVLGGQLLTLSPGRYRLSFAAEGEADGEGGRLAWTVSCPSGNRALASVAIAGVDFTPDRFSEEFSVPADCPAQWLRLTGKFGEFPKDQRVTISGLQIEEAAQS